ncbi:hypothetical protein [Nocardia harenae]|uniref:hypothetical protein n=1 Tax=Nocardia harenae TaxID=358707 RepID=UPI001FE0E60B|nr:hypothetical protein [Nocardia harenae]
MRDPMQHTPLDESRQLGAWMGIYDGSVPGTHGSQSIHPRALTRREADVIAALLATGADASYAAQIPHARVVATWGPGSPSVDLTVLPGATAGPASGIVAEAAVTDGDGAPIGELILWARDGLLSALEYAWYTDERPRCLPDLSWITTH